MNGEIPSVPITTLAGISSLTDLLPELPLPTPLPHTVNNKTLLFQPNIAEEAKAVLATKNESLVSQLVASLGQTSTEHIELKDALASDSIEGDLPHLLRAILAQDPGVFKASTQNNSTHNSDVNKTSALPGNDRNVSAFASSSAGDGSNHSKHGHTPDVSYQSSFSKHQATMNGGSPPALYASNSAHKPSASPAQASAAPSPREPTHDDQARRESFEKHKNRVKKQKSEPVVVLEPLPDDMTKDMMPIVSLTRIDDGSGHKKKHKHGEYVVSSAGSGDRLTLKLSKAKAGSKRRRSSSDDSVMEVNEAGDYIEHQNGAGHGEFSASLSERVKRRRKSVSYREDSGDEKAGGKKNEEYTPPTKIKDKKIDPFSRNLGGFNPNKLKPNEIQEINQEEAMRRKRVKKMQRANESSISLEELMETPTFRKFNRLLDTVLETAEDIDLTELHDDDDGGGGTSDPIVSRALISDLAGEAAKLKSMGVMNQVPTEKLVKVLTILQYNIRDGSKILPNSNDEEDEDHLWRELALEKVSSAVDAALIALYVMTSNDMPKEVFIEDVIDRVIVMAKIQLVNTVYPDFDPVYRTDPKNKSGVQHNVKLKRARASGTKNRTTLMMYNKLTDVVGTLAELVDVQELTDTIILQTSSMAVAPFFVENVSELQLTSLKLVTSIFSRYEKHRQLILEDVLSSLARLPSSKKNLRSYRLNSEEAIQMVSALVLQLIQCVVRLPTIEDEQKPSENKEAWERKRKKELMDQEVVIVTSYDNSMRTAHNFLAVFLKKCTTKGEEDYRPLFENFVYDLLATVNKPEWPAAELLLSLLGRLLVHQFSNKSVDMSLRVASLDYLGIVAARLRKDAVSSRLSEDTVSEIIKEIEDDSDSESSFKPVKKKVKSEDEDSDKTQKLQMALLEHLVYNADNDPALMFARQFYIAQWYRDCALEVEKATKAKEKAQKSVKPKPQPKKRRTRRNSSDDEDEEDEEEEYEDDDAKENRHAMAKELERTQRIQQAVEGRKDFLISQIGLRVGAFASFKPSPSKLDYDNACLTTRYIASNRPFSQSFDIYLTQILKVLCETAVAVRTKAMKCLSAVVEADPSILGRSDMQRGVHGRLLDQSTSVREAAVELLGKFILIRPELTTQYYDMLSARILDTGISVRKRVIKIFRDICMEQPEYNKIPEICVKMIRRVNDEEGIKKLVNETFQTMWFNPVRDRDKDAGQKTLRRVMNITDVVSACRDTGYDWFEQLVENLLKKESDQSAKPVEQACVQIVDCY